MEDTQQAERKPFEALAKELGYPKWLVAAVKAFKKLPAGQEMTASELEAIKAELNSIRIGR
jgi:hypothetical protein